MFRISLVFLIFALTTFARAQPLREVYLQRNSLDTPIGEAATTIFLTFDDGPSAQVTLPIAEVLADFGVNATFFAVGNKSVSPNGRLILSKLVSDGHLIANHTWAHRTSFRAESQFEGSLNRTTAALSDFLPTSGLIFFRSPGGVWNGTRTRWANLTAAGRADTDFAWYVGPIRWNAGSEDRIVSGQRFDAADWACWSKGISIRNCADGYLAKIRANYAEGLPSVVLMHDLRIQTRQLLIYVLEGLARDEIEWEFKRLDMARWEFARPSL